MTHFLSTQAAALALAAVVTLATLGGLSAVANTAVADEIAASQAQSQTQTVVAQVASNGR